MTNIPEGITVPELKPCPFCGHAPEVKVDLPRVGWLYGSAHISCPHNWPPHRAYSSESSLAAEWVGNDKPLLRYRTDLEAAQEALDSAARGWNMRSPS